MSDSRRLASPATDAARALVDEFIACGIRDIVVCPGSRSQALALAAAAEARADRIRLHVRIDERVAGFTALGLSRETRVPTVVVVTSGTGVANLAPAVWEAHHSAVPLLLLTADRPTELRGIGANQATDQRGAFAAFVRAEWDAQTPTTLDNDGTRSAAVRHLARDAYAAAMGAASRANTPPGPVHLNLPYRDPLSGEAPAWTNDPSRQAPEPPAPSPDAADEIRTTALDHGPRTVVIAGADAGPIAEEIAHAGRWPLIAEVVSGARFGRHVVHGYRALLADANLGARIERVIVFGHPTLARETSRLLSNPEVEVISIGSGGVPLNLNGATTHVDTVTIGPGEPDTAWLGEWLSASRDHLVDLSTAAPDLTGLNAATPKERRVAVDAELAALRAPLTRELLVDAIWRATWPHDRLVFGSSRLVRVADAVLGGKKVPVHANRGLAGIDGTIATGTGIAAASQADGARGMTRVLLGDLTFLHDVGGLLLPADEPHPRMQVIVGNDGGGTIFDGLEVAGVAGAEDMNRVQYTPQSVSLEHLAAAYGWGYVRVTTRSELDQALTSHESVRCIIEVPLPRS